MQTHSTAARPFATFPVKDGCAQCQLKAKSVPVSECEACKRGFVVRVDGVPAYTFCPTDPKAALVGDIMTRKAIAARPELPIESLILLLIDEGIQAVPVVDAEHRPVGMASKSDLVFDDYEWAELRDETFWLQRVAKLPRGVQTEGDLYLEELLRSRTVRDIMSGDPITVKQQTTIIEAARLMAERHVHGCPVIDEAGTLVGMVTALDVARWVGARSW